MSLKPVSRTSLNTGNNYYSDYTTTNAYVEKALGFPAKLLSLVNDSDSDPVQVSFDGATLHYELKGGEYKDITADGRTSVYVKATTGGEKVRITAV